MKSRYCIFKLAPHIHTQGHYENAKRIPVKEIIKSYIEYDIILLVVHSQDTNPKEYSNFVKECEKLSTKKRLIIPCLEDARIKFHLLLIGATSVPQDIFNKNRDYLIILAHPSGYGHHKRKIKKREPQFKELDGIEIWNFQHNSLRYPSLKAFNIQRNYLKDIKTFIGIDEHPPYTKREASIIVKAKKLEKESILEALKNGDFYNQVKDFKISSDGHIRYKEKKLNPKQKIKIKVNENLIDLISFSSFIGTKTLDKLGVKGRTRTKIGKKIKAIRKKL